MCREILCFAVRAVVNRTIQLYNSLYCIKPSPQSLKSFTSSTLVSMWPTNVSVVSTYSSYKDSVTKILSCHKYLQYVEIDVISAISSRHLAFPYNIHRSVSQQLFLEYKCLGISDMLNRLISIPQLFCSIMVIVQVTT